jgi:hypothetical protein
MVIRPCRFLTNVHTQQYYYIVSVLLLGHSNMIPCFPFHQKAWGTRAGGSLFVIHYHALLRISAPAILTTHAEATLDNAVRTAILIHYNE